MAADDNAPRAYKQSRRFETQDNMMSLLEADLAEAEALVELEEAPEPTTAAPEAATDAPQTPQDPSGEAQSTEATDTPETDKSVPADMLESLGRAGPAFLSNVADNVAGLVSDTAEYLSLPSMNFGSAGRGSFSSIATRGSNELTTPEAKGMRDRFDDVAGTPETMAGQLVQDAGGELIALIPIMRGLKAVGALRAGGQIMTADFAVTAAGSRKGQNTALGTLADFAGIDGQIRDAISNKADDSTAERMFRSGLEGVAIGKTFDVLLNKAMATFKWMKSSESRRSIAAAEDVEIPVASDAAANDIVAVRSEQEALIAIRENLDEIEAGAKELKEFGGGAPENSPESQAFLRSIVEAVDSKLAATDAKLGAAEVVDLEKQVSDLTAARDVHNVDAAAFPEAKALTQSIRDGIDGQLARVENELAQANAALEQSLRDSPNTPGEFIEALRQDLKAAGTIDKKTDAALGKIADERIAEQGTRVAPVKHVEVGGNHLRLKEADVARFRQAVTDGDFSAMTDVIAENFDSTNFDRIADSEEGIQQMLTGLLNEFSDNPNSLREMTAQSHAQTVGGAEGALAELSRETGQSAEAIARGLGEQLPGHELPAIMTAYRMFEVGLVKRVTGIADRLAEAPMDEAALADFTRYSILLANVNDKRAGVASILGRSLNAQKIAVEAPNLDTFLDAGRTLRTEQRRDIIAGAGGDTNILKLAEAVRMVKDPRKARLLIRSAADATTGTIGDINYAYVATNMLTAPSTHTTNIIGPLGKVLVWDPTIGIGGAVLNDTVRSIFGPTVTAATLRREMHFARAKWRGFANVLGFDFGARQASTLRSGVRQATMTGRRVTVPDGSSKFIAPGEGNALRALEMSRTIKAGAPMHFPFSSLINKFRGKQGGFRVKTLPGRVARGLGNALEASADGSYRVFGKPTGDAAKDIGKIYGPVARGIDYMSRVQSWPRHVIAAGDEIVAGLSAHAKLEADSWAEAAERGLSGQAAIDFTNDIRDNAFNHLKIMETMDVDDLEQVARVELLGRMSDSASDYVREATFTQTPGFFTEGLLKGQRYFPALRWFSFFARTGSNIARVAFNESLAGAVVQGTQGALKGDGEAVAMAASKAAVNLGVIFTAYDAYTEGNFTGSGPLNAAAREIWLEEHEPYSIWRSDASMPKGGEWISYARLDPLATPLQVMAELMDSFAYMDDDDAIQWSERLMQRMGRVVESKSFLQGMSDILGIVTGKGGFADAGIGIAKNFVPQAALLRSYARVGDPSKKLKDAGEGFELNDAGEPVPRRQGMLAEFAGGTAAGLATSLGSQIQAGLPVDEINAWTEMLNELIDLRMDREQYPERNLAGEISTYPPGMGPQMLFSFAAVEKDRNNPVIQEMIAEGVGFDLGTVFKTAHGVALSPQQQDFAHRYFSNPPGGNSKNILDYLQDVIDSPQYQNDLSTNTRIYGSGQASGRRTLLQNALTARLSSARDAVLSEFPAVDAQRKKQLQEKNEALFQENEEVVRQRTDEKKSTLIRALDQVL